MKWGGGKKRDQYRQGFNTLVYMSITKIPIVNSYKCRNSYFDDISVVTENSNFRFENRCIALYHQSYLKCIIRIILRGCKPCFKTKNKAWKKQKKEEEESKCSGKVDDGNETLDLEWMKRAHSRIKTDRKGFERKKRMKNGKKRKIVFSLRQRSAKIWRASQTLCYYCITFWWY